MMKRQKISDNNTDRLSDLPDHILMQILEFLDLKQSGQTCVLSKRWKDLWKKLTNLKFNHSGDNIDIISKFVSHIQSGRDDSLALHSLEYVHKLQYQDFPKTTLLEVVKYAASHNVQQLTVHVYLWLIKDLELPPSIFHCQSLTSLKLDFFCPSAHASARKIFNTLSKLHKVLKNNGSMSTQLPCFVRLKSLKVELFSNSKMSSETRVIIGEMVTYLLQNSTHDKVDVDILLKAGLT
ncbi:hypothetical protein P8452_45644 [Trifolium repens]|nr:hypothetical protein P8452_45644 [Trifolium repens]